MFNFDKIVFCINGYGIEAGIVTVRMDIRKHDLDGNF